MSMNNNDRTNARSGWLSRLETAIVTYVLNLIGSPYLTNAYWTLNSVSTELFGLSLFQLSWGFIIWAKDRLTTRKEPARRDYEYNRISNDVIIAIDDLKEDGEDHEWSKWPKRYRLQLGP